MTLDLHGASVDQAIELVRRIISRSARRGRSTLRVVHGASTSDSLARPRTIRQELYDLLDAGALSDAVVDEVRSDNHLLIGLAAGAAYDPTRLGAADLH